MESDIGVALFRRSTRTVELTEAGRVFLVKVRKAIAAADDAIVTAQNLGRGEAGELTLGVTPQARHEITPTLLRRFRERHPGITVSKREEGTTHLVDDVLRGRLDAAIGFCPASRPELSSVLVRSEPLLVAVPATDDLAHRKSVALPELEGQSLLLPSLRKADGYNHALAERCRSLGFEPTRAPIETDHDESFEPVRAGQGLELSTVDFVGTRRIPGIVLLEFDPPETLPIELVWRTDHENPVIDHFVAVVDELRDELDWAVGYSAHSTPDLAG
jgi:DNA-binding transcriptional LysR family regulator